MFLCGADVETLYDAALIQRLRRFRGAGQEMRNPYSGATSFPLRGGTAGMTKDITAEDFLAPHASLR
jgi:hypothetical protein